MPGGDSKLKAFLSRLEAAGIDASTSNLETWSRATFAWPARPRAIISPADASQAAKVVAIAGETGCPVHFVSRGRSWGLGSRLPVKDAAIVDLSRLDAILDIDMANGTARIEPGVTFERLQARLKDMGLRFHLPSFGGPIDSSVLANALERGDAAGPAGDRFAGLFDLDVALATGERFRTGFGRFGEAGATAIHGRPAGPLIDGILSQSGFGLVLSGRIALNPTPAHAAGMLVEIETPAALDTAMSCLRRLVDSAVLHPYDIAIWNQAKRVSSLNRGRSAIAAATAAAPRGWGLSLIVASDFRELFEARIAIIRREFQPYAREIIVSEDRTATGERLETHLTGFSHGGNLASLYAAKAGPIDDPLDPDRDGCGFLWLCPVLPFDGAAIREVEAILPAAIGDRPIYAAFGAQAVSSRALHGYVSLAWDRSDTATDREALAVHDQIAEQLAQRGYRAFRRAHPSIAATEADGSYSAVLQRLADALDPSGVMSPGKARPAGGTCRG